MGFENISVAAASCARFCAIALGFAIPISVALDNILMGVLVVSWVLSGNYRVKWLDIKTNPVSCAALLLFALLTFGLAYGDRYVDDGARYWGKYLDLLLLPIFISVFRGLGTRQDAMKAFCSAVMLSVLISVLTREGLLYLNPLVPLNTNDAPAGFKFSITHGLLVAFCGFVFALYSGRARRLWTRLVFIGLAVIAIHNALFVVISRTGYLVVGVLITYWSVIRFRWRGIAVAAVSGIILFGLSYYGSEAFQQRLDSAVSEVTEWDPGHPAQTSVGKRIEFYRSSVSIILQRPLLGYGTGSFPAVYAAAVADKHLGATVNPHNEYLLIAIQTGLVGLACLLALFYLQWRLAARLDELYRALARALVLLFVIGCMFNSLLLDHTEGLFFAWMTGLCFAGLTPEQRQEHST